MSTFAIYPDKDYLSLSVSSRPKTLKNIYKFNKLIRQFKRLGFKTGYATITYAEDGKRTATLIDIRKIEWIDKITADKIIKFAKENHYQYQVTKMFPDLKCRCISMRLEL